MTSRTAPADQVRGSVVVAVDGSEHAHRAVVWAADIAALERRHLVAMTVVDDGARRGDARLVVREAADRARAGHPELCVTPVVLSGDPRQVLLDATEDAYVLVMGSRGRGAVRTMLLGSVSAAVAGGASCPVVVCRPDDARATRHRGIVVGADGTPESRPVIELAYRWAFLRGVPLTVLHTFFDATVAVAQYREARGEVPGGPDLAELRASLADAVAGLSDDYPGVEVTFTVEHGLADQALTPRGDGWDLVVVGRHRMTTLERVLTASVATAVLERSNGTVVVVPELGRTP